MGRGEVHTGFQCENLRERTPFVDPSVDGSITLKWNFRKWDCGIDWIDLGQNRNGGGLL